MQTLIFILKIHILLTIESVVIRVGFDNFERAIHFNWCCLVTVSIGRQVQTVVAVVVISTTAESMVATSGEGQEMNQPSAVVNYYTSFSTKAYIAIVSLIVGSLLLFLFRGKAIALMKKYHSQWNDIKENPANLQLRYRLLLIVCTMMYGSNYVTTKYMQRRLAPSLTTTLRFFIASLFFLPEVLRYKGDAMLIYIGCEIGFYCAVAFCVQAVTLQLTSASKNAFLSSLAVVLIPMLDILYTNMFAPMVVPPGAPATAGGSHPLPHASTPALHAEGGTMRTFSTPRQQLLGAPLILTSRARANSCCSDEEAGGGEVERTGEQAALLEPSPVKVGALLTLPATPGPGVAIAGGKILTVFVPSLMSIMGVAVLELGGVDPPKAVDLLVCVVPVAFAFCYWRSEHASEQFPDDIPVLTGVYLSASCFFCLMFTFLQGEFPLTLKSDSALAVILLDWKIFVPLLYTGTGTDC